MDVPQRWRGYPCEDYFSSPFATDGFWDEDSQLWLIEPAERVEEEPQQGFLQVGRPGVDGIGFGYRKGKAGFWAFHRMDGEFQFLAASLEFMDGCLAGRISV